MKFFYMKNRTSSFFIFSALLISSISCTLIPPQRSRTISKVPRMETTFGLVRKKVALLPFYNETPVGGHDLAITAQEEFRRELSRSREFIFDAEAEKLFGSSKEIYAGGGVKLTQLARRAKMSGVSIVVFGRVKQVRIRQKMDEIGFIRKIESNAEAVVEIKVYDVVSNKEIFSDSMDGFIKDQNYRFFNSKFEESYRYRQDLLRYSTKVAVRKIIPGLIREGSRLDWMGRVARIIGGRIYINAGRISGIQLGDILKVVTEGQDIFDPESGSLIGISSGEVKGTLEVVDYFGEDGAICNVHSGGSVTEGDFIQLY